MLLPWCCKCCSRGSTGCLPPDLHLATTCCAQADSCPVACPSIPSITLSLLSSLSFRRTNHLNKILKMLNFRFLRLDFGPRRAHEGLKVPLVGFCRETPWGQNPWFHIFPPRPNSRGFTSIDVIRLQKRSTVTHTHARTQT
jgi:hypothetical protein